MESKSYLKKILAPFKWMFQEIENGSNFVLVNLTCTIILGIFGTVYHIYVHNTYIVEMATWAFIMNQFALYFYYRGKHQMAGNVLCAGVYTILFLGNIFSGGVNAPEKIWFLVAIAFAGLILETKYVIMWGMIYFLSSSFQYYLELKGFTMDLTHFPNFETMIFSRYLTIVCSLVSTSILIWGYIRGRNKTSDLLVQEKKNLQNSLEELALTKNLLESQLGENITLIRVLVHDVANPLSVIKLHTQSLLMLKDNPYQKQLTKISKSCNNIHELLNNVREWQSVKSGKKDLTLQAVSVQQVLLECEQTFSEKLENKNLQFKIHFEGPSIENVKVSADRVSLINNVLNNLISNAIKFSNEGSKIDLRVLNQDSHVCFKIRDYGVGIPKDLIQLIFSPTAKTSRPGTNGEAGTGFGLPIVKSYVEKFGGHIEVISKTVDDDFNDHGTEFSFDLKKAS